MNRTVELEKRAPAVDVKPKKRYAVIIDSGSSGSRAYVYSWPDFESTSIDATLGKSVPMISQVGESKKTKPGISTFHGEKLDELWSKHLKNLVVNAEAKVPVQEHYCTPVFLLATAGMRLLPDHDQKDILQQTCKLLQENSDFYIPECSTHVSVIDGETEGLYGWLSLNYLLNERVFSTKEQALSYGFMDMGGASAQIAFAPNRTETARHEEDLFHVNIRTLNGKTQDWKVFVSTWLGFGANEARNRFSEHLLGKVEPKQNLVADPCLPKGIKLDYGGTSQNSTVEFDGTGDFHSCMKNQYPLLQKGLPCKDDPCLFNGVHVPAIDYNVNRFVGVSEYWYTANDVLSMGGKYDFVKFSTKVKEYCEKPWTDIKKDHKLVDQDILRGACFKATWIINILHEGFGVPLGAITKRDLQDMQPTLQLHAPDNHTIELIQDDDNALAKRNLHDFLDPFQSAIAVNGQELSWTLGRALLYSSSQIPPENTRTEQVGYWPAGEDLMSAHGFVAGGELANSALPSRINLDVVGSGSGTILLAVVLVAILLVFAMFTNFINKIRLNFAVNAFKSKIAWLVGRIWPTKRGRRVEEDADAVRLLEEGEAPRTGLKHMPSFDSSMMRSRSSLQLANTTSMVDMTGLSSIPSRMNSRLGHRDEPVTFTLEDDARDPRRNLHQAASSSRLNQA